MFNRKIGTISWKIHTPYEGMFGKSGYEKEVTGTMYIDLTDAIAHKLLELKVYGGTELLPETHLDSVTLSGATEQRDVPSGYTQVEYLEVATVGAYLPTGINATVDTDMGITASNITANTSQLLIAQCESGSDYFRIAKESASQRIAGRFASSTVTDNNSAGVNKFTARINKSGFYVDGSLVGTFSDIPSSFTNIGAVDIFRGKYSSSLYYAYADSRFHSAWVDDNIFLPCRRNSDNQLGIYNTKTGQFILPSGNGTFIAGPDVVPTPSTPIDIVCNNGTIKVSKNLFNKNNLPEIINGYFGSSGTAWSYAVTGYSLRFPCLPNTTYTARYNGNSEQAVLSFASTNNDNIPTSSAREITVTQAIRQNSPTINTPITLTTGANDKWLIVQYNVVDPQNTDMANNLQIEVGSTATSYRPYGQIYTDGTQEVVTDSLGNTANAERLLAVGDYKDTQEVINGSVTKRIGITILDGTETWSKSSTYTGSFYTGSYVPDSGAKIADNPNVYCTHGFKVNNLSEYSSAPIGAIYWFSSTTINYKYDDGTATVAQFKQWLASQYANGTPVIVVYPLATATTESVTGQFLSKSPVTQTAGSISNLPIAITESSHTVPTPTNPLQINCNNGVLGIDGQGNITVTGTTETVEIDTTGDTATAEMLLKVGSYTDEQEILSGDITRKVAIMVLDGTENWGDKNERGTDSYRFTLFVGASNDGTENSLCTHISRIINSSTKAQSNRPCIRFNGGSMHWYETSNTTTLTQFKAFLAQQYQNGTPVIIVYPLATSTTETVAGQPMDIQEGNNRIEITQASMDDLELSAKYKSSQQ